MTKNKYVFIGNHKNFIKNKIYELLIEFKFECGDYIDMSGTLLNKDNGRKIAVIYDFQKELHANISVQENINDPWKWVKDNLIILSDFRDKRINEIFND